MVAPARPAQRSDVLVVSAFFRGHRFVLKFRCKAFAYATLWRWFWRGLLSWSEMREIYRRIKAC